MNLEMPGYSREGFLEGKMSKLYDVNFTFDPADFKGNVETVGIQGEFLFYESGLTGHTDETGMVDCEEKFPPAQYRDGLYSIGGRYYEEMVKNADGVYEDRKSVV